MTKTEIMADSFLTLLKTLPKEQRNAILARITSDEELAEDIVDLATFAVREKEPSRPLREYIADRDNRKARLSDRRSCP
jgi:hypothetical protein